jgi:hypothetical protein
LIGGGSFGKVVDSGFLGGAAGGFGGLGSIC